MRNNYSEDITITSLSNDVCQALAEYELIVAQRHGVSRASRPAVLRAAIRQGLITEGLLPDDDVSPNGSEPNGLGQVAGVDDVPQPQTAAD